MDLVKALETPEEKRLRRLAKKEAKNKQLMMEYTNDNNPFNDPELDKPFIWSKKYAAAGKPLPSAEEKKKLDKAKFIELQKIRERRKEREKEREARIKETEAKQRADEAGKFKNWVENEEQFLFKQAQLRSEIRMREGRAKPIDWLVAYINASCNEEPLPELVEPYHHLNGLRVNDLEDLQEDIKVYKQLDSSKNLDYWKDLEIIVSDELNKLKRHSKSKNDDGVNSEVAKEQNKLLASKNYKQLLELETSIEKKMADRKKAIDISYWENLLAKTRAFMARARLRDRHQELLKIKSKSKTNNAIEEAGPSAPREEVYDDNEDYVDPREIAYDEYQQGCYSPTLLDQKYCDESLIVNPDDDWKSLEIKRKQVINASNTVITQRSTLTAAEEAFEKVAKQGMESNEGVLKMEEIITQDPSIASWSEKYRPRKPRYFNRVHTGFEWNKYNQTHYDIDNPPPKIVQGYKFNIFYPDLIDKSKKPTYTVTPCADNKDFAIIRFSAGPPYEDIAFKIVNREWNYSHKSGFRNQISNGILQLWFHFKRYRYRR